MWYFWFPLIENVEDKRRRLSFFAMEDIVEKIFPSLFFTEVDRIIIVSHIRSRSVLYTLKRKLKFYGFKLFGFIKEFVNPHNGVKLRKKKRK